MLEHAAVANANYAKLFEGHLPPPAHFPACFAFSVHKAGSSLMHNMIADACRRECIPAISIPNILFREGITDTEWGADKSLFSLIRDGILYFGFRHLPSFLIDGSGLVRSRPAVLLVRDPRDALVSHYYSLGRGKHSSHHLPRNNSQAFVDRLEQTADASIDDYVVRAALNHRNKLQAYRDNLDFSLVRVFRYEDVYFNKKSFINGIFDHFEIRVSPQTLATVATAHDIRPLVEDPTKHIRIGAPGDHVNKLRPQTIVYLNEFFAATCADFGYQLR